MFYGHPHPYEEFLADTEVPEIWVYDDVLYKGNPDTEQFEVIQEGCTLNPTTETKSVTQSFLQQYH